MIYIFLFLQLLIELLLLLLSLLSQSLLVFFLCFSRVQTMHLERLKSIILFIHWAPFFLLIIIIVIIIIIIENFYCLSEFLL